MNANEHIEVARELGLLTKDNKINWDGVLVILEAGDWKKIARTYRDPIRGLVTASMWTKGEDYMKQPELEKIYERK